MVRIKRVYEPASPEDGRRILVDRLWPRGLKKEDAGIDEWLKDIAPSTGLRKWFSHDLSKWKEFRERYRQELLLKPEVLGQLRRQSGLGRITLLFSARDEDHNNAAVLMELIQRPSGPVGVPAGKGSTKNQIIKRMTKGDLHEKTRY